MANSKLLMLWFAISLAVAGIRADSEAEEVASDSHLNSEIEQLRSKISSLESSIYNKNEELRTKEDSVSALEKFLEEKSAGIVRLQAEIDSLKEKGSATAEEQIRKAHARAHELEKETSVLKAEMETLSKKSEALKARATEAENRVGELILQMESLVKEKEDLKRKLQKTERALEVAEEELLRAHLEATTRSEVLHEIHRAWFPPWLATRLDRLQEYAAKRWNEHGKPALDSFVQKASQRSAQAQKWAEPHLETAKSKWIPAVMERWVTFTTSIEPHVSTVSTKIVELFEVCRSTVTGHFVTVQKVTDPYVQEVRKLSKPYVDHVATITKPHIEKVRAVSRPYANRAVYAYGKFLESATTYHLQVQDAVQEKLKGHELTKALATKELVWFMASAALGLPIFFAYKIISAMFRKKARKPSAAHTNHAHRRHKRRHAD